jgi:hypothetical protein
MKSLIVGIAVWAASVALAQHGGNCVRLGTPLLHQASVAASIDTNPAEQATDAVLEVSLPKVYYDAGEPVLLDTHLRTRRGGDLDGGDVTVDDQHVNADPFDLGHPGKQKQKGQARGHGRHTVSLDNAPGMHSIIVNEAGRDGSGHPIKRGYPLTYVVATGELQFLDVTGTRPVDDALAVTLKVKTRAEGIFTISATLASGSTAVAEATRQVTIDHPGVSTVDLFFQTADIVEPGPYRLVNVLANGGDTGPAALAAAPHDVGRSFNAAHADHEPAPLRNEEGALIGGPYGPVPDSPAEASAIEEPGPNDPLSVVPPPPPEFGEPYIPPDGLLPPVLPDAPTQ